MTKSDMSGKKHVSPVWDYFKFNSEISRSECMANSGNSICGADVELELVLTQHNDAGNRF